jgi:ABC-type lipoprotein export system ATPase subunit/ABC-type antimicrobial peptide transport system permease subunit
MLKITKLNKYYNRKKANENHVIKNASIEFPDTGLVMILGQSGSGKTTLLNVLSGMDKFTHGKIELNKHVFTKYKHKPWDKVRNHEIGYIFQNYYLLNDLTVYDNIDLVLKMSGQEDKDSRDKRIHYLLEKVGMKGYHNRRANQLSGGQKQRVAFARAIANNPGIIIADEPTGNLDAKTTIEIMNIIKDVAKDKLVIMVTHETELADFYADRIIEISNGVIVRNEKNQYKGNLSIIQEHIIYLKDYQKEETSSEQADLITYSEEEAKKLDKIGVTLIKRNETLYVKIDSNIYKRIKYIDGSSEIELRNEHAKSPTFKRHSSFVFDKYLNPPTKEKNHVISFKDSFNYAKTKINKLHYGGKMLYFVLAVIGAIISLSVGIIGEVYHVEDSSFVDKSRDYIRIYVKEFSYEQVLAFEDYDFIEEVNFIEDQISFRIETKPYYEIPTSIEIDAHPTNINFLDEESIIIGEISSGNGVVIDQSLADDILRIHKDRGIETYEDILQLSLKMQASGHDYDLGIENSILFPITGIANDQSPTIWMNEGLMYSFAMPNLVDYQLLGDHMVITSGELPNTYKELLINEQNSIVEAIGVPANVGISAGRYDVSGTYQYIDDGFEYNTGYLMLSSLNYLKESYFYYVDHAFINFEFLAYSNDPERAIEELTALGFTARSDYLEDYDRYVDFAWEENMNYYIFSIIGILISAASIYFIMRSSLLSRIYEVSVYRALGASKGDIRRMFIAEIFITTSISTIVGFFLMMILLVRAQAEVIEYIQMFRFTFFNISLGVIAIYLIQTIFGLLPIQMLLFKTPSEILTKYDI